MRTVALLFSAILLIGITGCNEPPEINGPEPVPLVTGTLNGVLRFDHDVQADITGTRVDLYCSCDDMQRMVPAYSVEAEASGLFVFPAVCCRTYYVGAWKDNDQNGVVSSGDYLSERLNPQSCLCEVRPGNTVSVWGTLTVVP